MLDGPTNHLDVRHQLNLLATLRDLGIATLVTLRQLDLAAWCDQHWFTPHPAHLDGAVAVLIALTGGPARVLEPADGVEQILAQGAADAAVGQIDQLLLLRAVQASLPDKRGQSRCSSRSCR